MNAINWFEIPTANFARAVAFYEQILAVKLPLDASFPGIRMAIFPSTDLGVGGSLVEFEQSQPNPNGVRVYLNGGENLGQILDRVLSAGGQIVMPKTLLRDDIGYIGLFKDTEGNIVGLHSMH